MNKSRGVSSQSTIITAVQSQKAVTANLKSKQLLPFLDLNSTLNSLRESCTYIP